MRTVPVPTVRSSTEAGRAVADLASLLRFRGAGLCARESRRLRLAGGLVVLLTGAAIAAPAYLGGDTPRPHSGQVLALLPSASLAFLALATVAAVASGGGRELVPRDQAVAFPVSGLTEHLGALLLAPLNIAWLVQGWALLASASYALGPPGLVAYQLPLLLWLLVATALAQVAGWASEGVRRGRRGTAVFRLVVIGSATLAAALVVTGQLAGALDRSPTVWLLRLVLDGQAGRWAAWSVGVAVLVLLGAAATIVGAVPARWALSRPMREELRLESGHQRARALPGSDFAMLLRIDRAAVWRSVPLRRGLVVLALMPGGVALAGDLDWAMVTVLPGLVASGGALLFGVNTWCLDGRGALWRESLPVSPRAVYYVRATLLFEVLAGSAAVTLALAALRAGRPTITELVAVLCALSVITVQVVAAAMRWSLARPFSVDLRSARATPAPPVVMVGYSARLATVTTVTGLVFSGLARTGDPGVTLLVAAGMLVWSLWRLERTAQRWERPLERARVVTAVAG